MSTQFGVKPLIIEQTHVACAASGKAGGFLAREWGSGPTVPLHQISYDLHKSLAQKLSIESYREILTLEVQGGYQGKRIASWLDREAAAQIMDSNTAQVTSAEFTEKVLSAAMEAGTELLIDSVNGLKIEDNVIRGVFCEKSGEIAAGKVIICMGPWSCKASLSLMAIYSN